MLVLTQREGEILQIGDDIRIYIKRIKGGAVRLCIDAPPEVDLQRIVVPEPAGSNLGANERRSRKKAVNEVEVVTLPRRR